MAEVKAKIDGQKVVDELLKILIAHKELTVNLGVELLESASMQLRSQAYEAMSKESARPICEVFEAKADIKIVQSLH